MRLFPGLRDIAGAGNTSPIPARLSLEPSLGARIWGVWEQPLSVVCPLLLLKRQLQIHGQSSISALTC